MLGVWIRVNLVANLVEFPLMNEDPEDSVIRTVDTVFKSPVNWSRRSAPSEEY